jgi:flagellar hook-length control protein FliK
MLNTALPISAALPGSTTPANAGAPADDGAGFAQALDQAEARHRDAAGADAAEPVVDKKTASRGDKAAARMARPAVDAEPTALALTGPFGLPPEETLAPATAASTDESLQPAEPVADAPTAGELAAWVSALPLPRPTPAADEASPQSMKTSLPVTAMTPGPAAHAAAVALANAARKGSKPDIELPAVGPRAPETTAAAAIPAHAAARGTATPAAAAHAAATPTLPTIEAALRATGLVRETAPAGAAESPMPMPLLGITVPPGAAQRPDHISAPLQVELREPVDSKAFAPALGAQLSVLVRNGIEQAQLQLHPAELGPIDVRIRVDGQEAQVDFSAAHAATRQALQDAVPALAGALRDSGLTLTGGGVYEQARDPRGQAQQQIARGQAGTVKDDGAATLQASAPRGARARGVVDLYA